MNHLDLIRDMRMGPPWAQCIRATYQLIGMTETYTVECWHDDHHGPVLDPADLRSLEWTTAEESALDDGTLSIVDPMDAGRHIQIKPLLFQDASGAMRLGWPMAGYANVRDGERWVRATEPPEVASVCAALSDPALGALPSTAMGEPPVESHIPRPPPALRPITTEHQSSMPIPEFTPMPSGPAHISGTFVIHLSADEVDDLINDLADGPDTTVLEDGKICRTQSIGIKEVIEAAAEKVSPRFADLVADLENAIVSPDGSEPGAFNVTFTYDLDI